MIKKYNCTFESEYLFIDDITKQKTLYINPQKHIAPFKGVGFEEWQLGFCYRKIIENTVINTHFDLSRFEIGFNDHGKFFVPYFYQAFLIGAIGEEAIKAVFAKPQSLNPPFITGEDSINKYISYTPIPLDEDEIPDELFELADTKVKGKAWFIDCKNYSLFTLTNFPLTEADNPIHPKLNDPYFEKSAIRKYKRISQHYQVEDSKLIYINFIGAESGKISYYDILDKSLHDVKMNFEKAKIIIVQGVIKRENSNQLTEDFIRLLKDLKNNYHD